MKYGFTLIELLVVVLIIGILAAIALPQYQRSVMRVKSTELFSVLHKVYQAEKAYYMANGTYTAKLDDLDTGYPFGFDSAHDRYTLKGMWCLADIKSDLLSCQSTNIGYYHQYSSLLNHSDKYCYAATEVKFLCENMGGKNGVEYKTGSWRYTL